MFLSTQLISINFCSNFLVTILRCTSYRDNDELWSLGNTEGEEKMKCCFLQYEQEQG